MYILQVLFIFNSNDSVKQSRLKMKELQVWYQQVDYCRVPNFGELSRVSLYVHASEPLCFEVHSYCRFHELEAFVGLKMCSVT